MSTRKWRMEQPRVPAPRSLWFWVDAAIVSMLVAATLMHAIIFVTDGWWPGLVMALWSGFIVARFYPFRR